MLSPLNVTPQTEIVLCTVLHVNTSVLLKNISEYNFKRQAIFHAT